MIYLASRTLITNFAFYHLNLDIIFKGNDMNKFYLIVLIVVLYFFPISTFCDMIPTADQLDWSAAGLYSDYPTIADTVFQINLMSGTSWSEKLTNAIAGAKSYVDDHPTHWVIIYFPKGTYTLTSEVIMDETYRNIIFQGAGADKTTLKFDFNISNKNCFKFSGYQNNGTNYLSTDLQKKSTSITSSTNFSYTAPQWVRLCEEDHPSFDNWAEGSIGQITSLETINGTSATMKDEASKQYTVSRNTSIRPITPNREMIERIPGIFIQCLPQPRGEEIMHLSQ